MRECISQEPTRVKHECSKSLGDRMMMARSKDGRGLELGDGGTQERVACHTCGAHLSGPGSPSFALHFPPFIGLISPVLVLVYCATVLLQLVSAS